MLRLRLACLALASALCCYAADGALVYDGSSTVYPIVVAAAERYAEKDPRFQVEAQPTGSSAGIRSLLASRCALAGASRPMNAKELQAANEAKISFVEVPIAFDALSVVANPRNAFLKSLTVAELKRLWTKGGPSTWKQLRAEWPDAPIHLFAPGTDSGTYDFFKEVIVGKDASFRDDATTSEDDHVLVQGVSADVNAIAFFGLAYVAENQQHLRALAIDNGNGKGAIAPSRDQVLSGAYAPLARPIFLYIPVSALARTEVNGFVQFLLDAPSLIEEVGYVPLPAPLIARVKERLAARTTGSLFGGATAGVNLASVLLPPAPVPAPAPVAAAKPAEPAKPVEAPKPVWKGPTAKEHQLEVDRLRAAVMALARASLDSTTTVEDLARQTADLKRRTDALAAAFQSAPRTAGKDLTLGEASRLAQ
jgi:phosphate transport system substrate-binding protein